MEDRLLDKIAEPFNLQLPEYPSMKAMLDGVLPSLRGSSRFVLDEDDPDNPLFTTTWVKMTDTPGRTEVVLYNFNQMGNIEVAVDGAVDNNSFDIKSASRMSMGTSPSRGSILFDLVYLDRDYFILARNGNRENFKKGEHYVMFCSEPIGTRLKWDEALERLVARHRDGNFPVGLVVAFLAVVLLLLYFFY